MIDKERVSYVQELTRTDSKVRYAMMVRCYNQGHVFEKHTRRAYDGSIYSQEERCIWCCDRKELLETEEPV